MSDILEVKYQELLMQSLTTGNGRAFANHNTNPQISGNGRYKVCHPFCKQSN
jgi:hypothetical protein